MKYRIFTYPVPCDEAVAELNSFLSSHRILRVRDEVVLKGNAPYLLFVVEYLDGPGGEKPARPPKVDYREELSDEEFAVFSALRDWRKARSDEEGVPVYTIFTNAQLAEIVKKKVETLAELGNVEGVGKSRVEKYGEALLEIFKDFTPPSKIGSSSCGVAALECGGSPPLSKRSQDCALQKGCTNEARWLPIRAHSRTGESAGGVPCHAAGESRSTGGAAVSRRPACKPCAN